MARLCYFRGARPNFGDELNPWLWPRLLSGFLDNASDELGIGTTLNTGVPSDVDALTNALHRLRDDSLVRRLSEQAYRTMSSGPQRPAAHADGLVNIYRSILAEHQEQAA